MPAPNIRNLTTDEQVKVRLEQWGLSLPEARELLSDPVPAAITWHPPWPGI